MRREPETESSWATLYDPTQNLPGKMLWGPEDTKSAIMEGLLEEVAFSF